jgi:hypothetical protein
MSAGALLPKPFRRCPKDDGDGLLHNACYSGAYESALMLILSGADVMARNVWQATPLHHSTSQGHLDIMLLLLDSGVCVNARDHENLTPLHQAVIHSNKHAAELLLCYGASVHNDCSVKDGTLSALELASRVHVCHEVVQKAMGESCGMLFLLDLCRGWCGGLVASGVCGGVWWQVGSVGSLVASGVWGGSGGQVGSVGGLLASGVCGGGVCGGAGGEGCGGGKTEVHLFIHYYGNRGNIVEHC